MHTTTIAEKLLARATEYEQKAAALRVAAGVMNGEALAGKQVAMAATIAAATKVRQQQHGNGNGHAPPPAASPRQRAARDQVEAVITEFLASGSQPAREITTQLQAAGFTMGHARVTQILAEMRTAKTVRTRGLSANTRWELRPRKAKAVSEPEPSEGPSPFAAREARRADKVVKILDILREHGKPMPLRDLVAAAREAGIPSLTGIYGLVKRGVLASRGSGSKRTYRYVDQRE